MILGKNIKAFNGERVVFSTNYVEDSDRLYKEKETQNLYLIQILTQNRFKDPNINLENSKGNTEIGVTLNLLMSYNP